MIRPVLLSKAMIHTNAGGWKWKRGPVVVTVRPSSVDDDWRLQIAIFGEVVELAYRGTAEMCVRLAERQLLKVWEALSGTPPGSADPQAWGNAKERYES